MAGHFLGAGMGVGTGAGVVGSTMINSLATLMALINPSEACALASAAVAAAIKN